MQELRGHAVAGSERVQLLHSGHAAVVQWYIAAGRLAQSYSSPAGKVSINESKHICIVPYVTSKSKACDDGN